MMTPQRQEQESAHPRRWSPYNFLRDHVCGDCGKEHQNYTGSSDRCDECVEKGKAHRRTTEYRRTIYRKNRRRAKLRADLARIFGADQEKGKVS